MTVFGYMITLQPFVALVTLAIFSPQFVFVPLMQRAINRRTAARVKILREVSADIIESVTKDQASAGNEARINRIFELNMGIFRVKFSMNFLMNLIHHLQIVGALLFGGWSVVQGITEVGTIVAFVSGITRANDPWGDLVNYFRDLTSAQVKYRLLVDAVDAIGHDGARH